MEDSQCTTYESLLGICKQCLMASDETKLNLTATLHLEENRKAYHLIFCSIRKKYSKTEERETSESFLNALYGFY